VQIGRTLPEKIGSKETVKNKKTAAEYTGRLAGRTE